MHDRGGKVGGQTLSERMCGEAVEAVPTPGRQTLVQLSAATAPASAPVQRSEAPEPSGPAPQLPHYASIQRIFGDRRVQAKAGAGQGAGDVHAAAAEGISGPTGVLPHLEAIQRSFGRHDVRHVQAHVGGAAATGAQAMGAEAFATGDHVAFANAPSLHIAAHEAAHVVQQRGGVQLKGGVGQTGDRYEQHADAVADAVVRGESAEALLDQHASGAATGEPVQRSTIQKKDVSTSFGTFKSTKFSKFGTTGVDCVLEFHPDADKIDATKIGLSQSYIKTNPDGSHTGIDPTTEGRRAKGGAGADYALDRLSARNNPIYGAADLGAGDGIDKTQKDNNTSGDPTKVATPEGGGNATYQLGYAYTDGGAKKTKEAALFDRPQGSGKTFETTALGLEGTDHNKYFGSVKWGFDVKAGGGDVDIKDIELAAMGVPTQNYLAPAKLWNEAKARGTLEVITDPARARKTTDMSAVDVAKGTKVRQTGEALVAGEPSARVETLDRAVELVLGPAPAGAGRARVTSR